MVKLRDYVEPLAQGLEGTEATTINGVPAHVVEEVERLIREDERQAIAEGRTEPEHDPDLLKGHMRMRAPPYMSGRIEVSAPPGPNEPYELPCPGGILKVHPHHVRHFERMGFTPYLDEEELKAQAEADEKAKAADEAIAKAQADALAEVHARAEAEAAAAAQTEPVRQEAQPEHRTRRQRAADERR